MLERDGSGQIGFSKAEFVVQDYHSYAHWMNEKTGNDIYVHNIVVRGEEFVSRIDETTGERILREPISKLPNPRPGDGGDIGRGIYKNVKNSYMDGEDSYFDLKSNGIQLLAKKVKYNSNNKKVVVYFDDTIDGICNGGHLYEIIRQIVSGEESYPPQCVEVKIISGTDRSLAVRIAEGRNTQVQVHTESLTNLEGKFDWFKELVEGKHYADNIAYYEKDNKDIDMTHIIKLMTAFNINLFPNRGVDGEDVNHPIIAYASKDKVLRLYRDNYEKYKFLSSIVPDILELSEYVHIKSREEYNRQGGKAGALKAIFETRERGEYYFPFTKAEAPYRLYLGILFPIMGGMRFLVKRKRGMACWKIPFSEVKILFCKKAKMLINKAYRTGLAHSGKSNTATALGKNQSMWDIMYMTIEAGYRDYMRKRQD